MPETLVRWLPEDVSKNRRIVGNRTLAVELLGASARLGRVCANPGNTRKGPPSACACRRAQATRPTRLSCSRWPKLGSSLLSRHERLGQRLLAGRFSQTFGSVPINPINEIF